MSLPEQTQIPSPSESQYPTELSSEEIRFLAERGVDLCRQGDWKKGFEVLSAVAETDHREGELPGVFHSYLGYAVARCQRNVSVGRALAKHATESRFFEPENFLNLARIELLAGNRRQAYRQCRDGLRLDPRHRELRRFLKKLGKRRRPLLAFLPRSNAVNRLLGRTADRLSSAIHPSEDDDGDLGS